MSTFPETRHDMVRASYRKTGDSKCKGCGAAIEWWKTTNNKPLPIDALKPGENERSLATVHWATCPNAKDFKGAAATPAAPPASRHDVLTREVRALREKYNLRVVVAVDELGTFASWKNEVPGEDLRHELISAGNFVRTEIAKKEDQR